MADEDKKTGEEKKPVPEYCYGKYSNYQRIQTNKYNKANYDTITLRLRNTGQGNWSREGIRLAAELSGMSLNQFCTDAIARRAFEVLEEYEKNRKKEGSDDQEQVETNNQ